MIKNYATKYFYAFSFLITLLLSNVSQAQTTTWTGSWDNGNPDITKDVVFTANYTSIGDFSAKSVSVSNNAVVTIVGGLTPNTLTVQDNITIATGSNLIFETNSSLLQINPVATNSGNINYKRDSTPMKFFEYTYWSTPVSGQTLVDFSPLTSPSRYHSFNSTINNWVNESPTNIMQSGRGYAIRSPDDYTSTPQAFNGEFIGVPNNGNIPTNVIAFNPSLLNYNFIGNPYPSAISIISLLDNSNLGTMYFWTHNTAIAGNVFTTNDYAIRTRTTGTAAISGGTAPGLYIAAGQGFFASAATTTTLTFTNSMRVANNNSQFYKNSQVVPLNYYIHLNLTNTSGAFKQIAFGYEEGATNGYDFGTDALASTEGAITFYSTINPYTFGFGIQGREYPWNLNDVIDLGINATIAGDYTITIDHVNTFFDSQDIFIEDTILGTYSNLKTGPYNFNTAVGVYNSRFKIHYVNPLLGNNDFILNANSVFVNTNNNEIEVHSTSQKIKNIQVYDILGRLIFDKKDTNENKISITSIRKENQALIIKTELENNEIVTKKLIF
ncbi:MAG: T9SS sorting signal type C domain-containing protein [Flavobacterium sp.]|uniref:T9SS sorting signal type C domain-containing protein n=1 Tax=Flavobacterium sp. TaxID=239 RepID=UPI0032633186